MLRFIQALEQRLLFYARRAGIKLFVAIVAAVLAGLGMVFLVHGLWLLTSLHWGPIAAAFALGALFLALAGLALWLGTLRRRAPPPLPPPAYSSPRSASIVALVEAFMLGLNAGRDKGKKDE